MKVLFWVGYANPTWDKGDWINNGMGGSEYCVIKLADYLDLNGFNFLNVYHLLYLYLIHLILRLL